MKFLHVNPSMRPEYGGPADWIANVSRLLISQGHTSDVLTRDDPSDPVITEWGIPVTAVGPSGPLGLCPAVGDWLRKNASRYDVVLLHNIWDLSHPIAWRALRARGVRTWVMTHGMLDPWFNTFPLKKLKKQLYWPWAVKASIRDSEAVLFTTEEERLLARQSFHPYEPKEAVISFGIPGPLYDQAEAASAFHEAAPSLAGRPYLLFLSRIHHKKGCDLLIEALASTSSSVQLVMAGPDDGGLRPGLEALAQRVGCSDRIHWTGMLRGSQKWGALDGCMAFVLTSHQENFGIAVAEAMAVGKPVLITNKVNIHREVSDYGGGMVTDDTVEGASRLLKGFLELSEEERLLMGERARRCFAEKFEISQSAADVLRLALEPASMTHPYSSKRRVA